MWFTHLTFICFFFLAEFCIQSFGDNLPTWPRVSFESPWDFRSGFVDAGFRTAFLQDKLPVNCALQSFHKRCVAATVAAVRDATVNSLDDNACQSCHSRTMPPILPIFKPVQ